MGEFLAVVEMKLTFAGLAPWSPLYTMQFAQCLPPSVLGWITVTTVHHKVGENEHEADTRGFISRENEGQQLYK